MLIRHIIAAGLLAGASASQAGVIFSDNFDADLRGLNKTTFVGGWTVGNGSVDVIGAGPGNEPGANAGQAGDATGYNFGFSQGNFIDLDGSTSEAGIFSKSLSLIGGQTYVATFQLAGSQRNFTETVDVSFGTSTAVYSFANTDGFSYKSLTFTPTTSGTYALSFSDRIDNMEGVLLDNVSVSAVPEPSSYALLLAGVAAIGFVARRRIAAD